ncbi:hypothetical protein [Methylobacterium cerastii]|uniref:hypothetical protein n=1 Tax=Methylobacterium cerastii TaxID=932741 RepID=UPI001EE2C857|nr:hypothetical protein [Methylobacterium cerastii]
MQHGSDDPAAIAMVVHVGATAIGLQDLLNNRLVIWTCVQGFQQTRQAKRGDVREVELTLVSGPNLALRTDAGS